MTLVHIHVNHYPIRQSCGSTITQIQVKSLSAHNVHIQHQNGGKNIILVTLAVVIGYWWVLQKLLISCHFHVQQFKVKKNKQQQHPRYTNSNKHCLQTWWAEKHLRIEAEGLQQPGAVYPVFNCPVLLLPMFFSPPKHVKGIMWIFHNGLSCFFSFGGKKKDGRRENQVQGKREQTDMRFYHLGEKTQQKEN